PGPTRCTWPATACRAWTAPPRPELVRQMQLRPGRFYSAPQLTSAIRNAFGTRRFRKITYALQPVPDSSARLVLDVERTPRAWAWACTTTRSLASASSAASRRRICWPRFRAARWR
ncbi:hypothetical protein, partial [Hymenobacter coccineus]|uniref:hypothetical protein n=1 Tax=Hymenobacter coccineus TaxID=1908235 RepID=UPI001955D423